MTEHSPVPKEASGRELEPVPFANASLGKHRHICALFRSPEEQYRVLIPFIKEGIERGDRAFHVVDPQHRQDHIQRLLEAGVDILKAMTRGQFELYDWDQAYFPTRGFEEYKMFDQKRMFAFWREVLQGAEKQSYPLTRLVTHMEWALEDREGVHDLLEYEARCNFLCSGRRDVVICTYDLRRHPAEVIIDVIRTHPIMIIGDTLQENPFFVPPEVFLEELRSRKASAESP
jgi:MEDS: MEthanogen/methylotroph, DcmR Sensory domain